MRLLTLARDLRRRRARERLSLFAVEGVRAVEELERSPITVRGVLHATTQAEDDRRAQLIETLRGRGVPILEVSDADLASAADTESPQGIIAVAEIPTRTLEQLPDPEGFRICVLDAVQDPGNAGAILRTAAALGALATIALPGTVDLWNAKVVRSSMGALFLHPALGCTWSELDAFLATRRAEVWAADAAGELLDEITAAAGVPRRIALVVGNEGAGLSSTTRERADRFVALPIAAHVESLNVAVATGILLYELRR